METQPYPFLIKRAVDQQFLDHVTDVTFQNEGNFRSNKTGEVDGRKFMVIDFVTPDGDRYLYDEKQKLAARYDLGEYVVPPGLKDFINVITEGGFVHEHTDPDLPGRRHVRINVIVRQTEGCLPTLDGVPIRVEPGDCWLNLASQCRHGTTPAVGPGYRSAISFGFQIDEKRGRELQRIHERWLAGAQDAHRSA